MEVLSIKQYMIRNFYKKDTKCFNHKQGKTFSEG